MTTGSADPARSQHGRLGQMIIGSKLLRSRLRGGFSFCATTHKEAAKVAPDGSHSVHCIVIGYEAHAVTCLATTVALIVDPRERRADHDPVRETYKTGILTENFAAKPWHFGHGCFQGLAQN